MGQSPPLPELLKDFELEFETVENREAELDDIVSRAPRCFHERRQSLGA